MSRKVNHSVQGGKNGTDLQKHLGISLKGFAAAKCTVYPHSRRSYSLFNLIIIKRTGLLFRVVAGGRAGDMFAPSRSPSGNRAQLHSRTYPRVRLSVKLMQHV